MSKQKLTAIQFSMVPLDEDENPIMRHGFRAHVARGTNHVAVADQLASAARAAALAIMSDYEIGEVKI